MIRIFAHRTAVLLVVLAGVACHRSARVVVLGLGYRAQQRAAAIASETYDTSPGSGLQLRITAETGTTSNSPADEVTHATRLAAMPGIAGVVGHGGSREALLTAPIYNESRIPQIVPTGTSRRLGSSGPWTFTLAPNDSIEGEYLGHFVAERLRARTVTLFYVLDEYGAGLRDGALSALTQLGVTVLDVVPVPISGECPPTSPTNTFAGTVDAALLRGRPDVVVLAARQRESGCIVSRVHARFPNVTFVAGDGLLVNADFLARAGGAADGLYAIAFWHPDRADSASRAFVRRYAAHFGRAPGHDEAMVFDAITALMTAVQTVGPDRAQVRDYLASLGHSRPPLHGVTGPISFPGGRDRLMMTRVWNGHIAVVESP